MFCLIYYISGINEEKLIFDIQFEYIESSNQMMVSYNQNFSSMNLILKLKPEWPRNLSQVNLRRKIRTLADQPKQKWCVLSKKEDGKWQHKFRCTNDKHHYFFQSIHYWLNSLPWLVGLDEYARESTRSVTRIFGQVYCSRISASALGIEQQSTETFYSPFAFLRQAIMPHNTTIIIAYKYSHHY